VRSKQLFISLTLGLGLTLVLLWLLGGATLPAAYAAPPQCPGQRALLLAGDVITVCLSGGCDYASIQDAVDAADPGGEILVATSTYTGVNVRPRNDITTTGVVTQVVYISKTVAIRGGYNADFSAWDPHVYSTTLDAQRQGRVIYVTGEISPTIEGLRITGGDAIGLGGAPWGWDSGGGVYVVTATATISNNQAFSNTAFFGGGVYVISGTVAISNSQVFSNTADYGGGLFLYYSDATLSNNTVISNTASDYDGGGLLVYYSDATLSNNTVISNTAELDGGGLCLYDSGATLRNNTVISNTASNGGGLCLYDSAARLSGNTVTGNTADPYGGGGLFLYHSDATLSNNIVIANTAKLDGGGLALWYNVAMLTNNVVADNQADRNGSGLYIFASSPRLLHTTIARNVGSSGVYITDWVSNYSTVALTNTILVSHTVGITVAEGNTVTLESTLWYSNTTADWGGAGTIITGTHNYWDDPAFVNPDAGDYHIGLTSAAIDKGVDAGVGDDIDGDLRPQDSGYDLGADEFVDAAPIYLPLLMRQYP
jgi:parallel beta-helix repeat protein